MTSKLYIASLSDYNSGRLVGAWIDATSDADEMFEAVAAILKTSKEPIAEEFAIHDVDDADGILGRVEEFTSLREIAKRVEAAELAESEIGSDGPAIVAAYWDHMGGNPDDAQDAVEKARDAYLGEFDNMEAYAEDYCEQTGLLESIPENLRYYFDFEAFGRDIELNGDVFTVKSNGSIYVFNNH